MNGAYAGTRVLVLGASGFIGGWVVRALARLGASPLAVVRDVSHTARVTDLGAATVIVADLMQPDSVAAIVRDASPAITFNLAGYGVDRSEHDSAHMQAMNATLPACLCQAVADLGAASPWNSLRLVHVGSALEYGQVHGQITEDVTPQPDTDYGRTKLMGTEAVLRAARTTGLRAAVVRLFTVYGPGEHATRLLPTLMDAARLRTTVSLTSGDQPRDFTYVEDAVDGLLRTGRTPESSGQLLNVATGHLTTVRKFAETAAKVLGIPEDRLRFGAASKDAGEMYHGEVSTALMDRVLGWRPGVSVTDGIRRAWDQERKKR